MEMGWSSAVETALCRLVAEGDGDIVLRLSREGEIEDASASIKRLDCDLSAMLLKPHIADLAQRDHQASVRQFVGHALDTKCPPGRIEFPIPLPGRPGGATVSSMTTLHWHSLGLFPIADPAGRCQGALGLLRSIDQRRALETELNASATIDPLTGLDNHRAFAAHLDRFAASSEDCAIALCQLEHCRALQSRYGRSAAEDVVWAFARFLRNLADQDFIVARLDGDRFGVLMPRISTQLAVAWGREVAAALDNLSRAAARPAPELAVTIGVADLSAQSEKALHDVEIALVMARASGGVRCYSTDYPEHLSSSQLGGPPSSR